MSKYNLEYFYYDACPFCQVVKRVIKKHSIKVEYKDILADSEALDRLINDTGRRTVPCMYINGKPMFESADIAAWLEAHKDELEKKS
jgi:glutaredoxin